ncbi:MAG: GPR endopeptidase, partial [Ruminococcaceae bacterium]|nr:GPR endopeptidase [Oscillospiraceae bacterium]
ITGELRRSAGMEGLRPAAVIAPGVLGQTGIEVLELLTALCGRLRPAAVVVVDAMASRRLSRLGCTVQISDAGISPGAGVGNNRPAINQKRLGVPVLSLGVPTVVEAATLARDLAGEDDAAERAVSPRGERMIVTPREIDLLIDRASRLLALSLNHALQPDFDPVELLSLC